MLAVLNKLQGPPPPTTTPPPPGVDVFTIAEKPVPAPVFVPENPAPTPTPPGDDIIIAVKPPPAPLAPIPVWTPLEEEQ